jgi:integrase
VLRTAIRYAWHDGELTHEVPVTLPDWPPARDLWLTRDEAALLLRGARAGNARLHLPYFVMLGLYAGHRKRAILELQWQPNTVGGHVDMARGMIDFRRRGPQTRKRRTHIPIPRRLATFLPYLRRRTRQYVLEWRGKPIGNIKKAFNNAARSAARLAIERGRSLPKWHPRRSDLAQSARKLKAATPHTLRHTCVTWLVAKGIPYADIGGWVAMTPAIVEKVYSHHSPEQHKRVRAVEGRQ